MPTPHLEVTRFSSDGHVRANGDPDHDPHRVPGLRHHARQGAGRLGLGRLWYLTKKGANVAPGATWFRTSQEAQRAADLMVVVDGDGQKWWALWRAITNPYGR